MAETDWKNLEEDGCVAIQNVKAVAVYWNTSGELVIRQEADECDESDDLIVVPATHVKQLVEKINEVAKLEVEDL